MRIADAIFSRLAREVDTVFYLPGGGASHLVDALGRSGLRAVSCLHEQGAGYAAVGYAQHRGFGVCLTTSGPGITNCITPIAAAWVDSVPLLVISGQVNTWQTIGNSELRCKGTQEIDATGITRNITKRNALAMTPAAAIEELEKMIELCKSGRPGPCHLDTPMDVQKGEI